MCLTETYSRVRVGKNLSDMFPIKNGLKQEDALSSLLFNFALVYVIRRVQVNQNSLKLNGTHHLLAFADDFSILGGSIHTIKKNAEALVVSSKETGQPVNADKTRYMYMVMSWNQNAGWDHNMKLDSSSFLIGWKSSNIWEKL